jgi:flagellar hook-associated protein 2
MGISLNPATLLSGQGIDVTSAVQQALATAQGPLTVWQNQQSSLQAQASDLTIVNGDLSNLASAVQALSDPLGALTGVTATSSDNSVLSATATNSATAATHEIVVNSLATQGLVYTNAFSGGPDASILPSGATSGEIDCRSAAAPAPRRRSRLPPAPTTR